MTKQTCIDMFQDTRVKDIPMYRVSVPAKVHEYKKKRKELLMRYNRLSLVINLRILKGLFYIETLLKKISLAK